MFGCLPGQGRGRVILFGSGSLANLPHPAPLPCLLGFSGFGQKIEWLIEDCGQYDVSIFMMCFKFISQRVLWAFANRNGFNLEFSQNTKVLLQIMDIGAIDMRFVKFGCMTQVLIRIWLQTSFKSVNYMDCVLPRVVMQWIWDGQF